MCKIQIIEIKEATENGEMGSASPRMTKGTKTTASWVSSIGTDTRARFAKNTALSAAKPQFPQDAEDRTQK
jgi:hypothetical protein